MKGVSKGVPDGEDSAAHHDDRGDVLVVGPNLTVDQSCTVGAFPRPGDVVRAESELITLGGKGANIGRALGLLSVPYSVIGVVAGGVGTLIRELAAETGINLVPIPVSGQSRIATILLPLDATDAATVINPPGPQLTERDASRFLEAATEAMTASTPSHLVCAGSLPPGTPANTYALLVAAAREAGIPTIVDTSGAPLLAALDASPTYVKVNLDEALTALEKAARRRPTSPSSLVEIAADLAAFGNTTAIVTDGSRGVAAAGPQGRWSAQAPPVCPVDATGAGDAFVAGFVTAERDGSELAECLRRATATASASVTTRTPGGFEVATGERLRAQTVVVDESRSN